MNRRVPLLVTRLEPRLTPSATYDAGDYYFAGDERIELTQQYDTFAVKLDGCTRIESLLAPGGPFAGGVVERAIDRDVCLIRAGTYSRDVQPGEVWVSPLYVSKTSQTWRIATNEVIIALKSGEVAEDFFDGDTRFSGYRPLLGTPDQFVGIVAAGGGVAALTLANDLHDDPRLRWASPNLYQDWRPFFTPNDPLYPQQWHLHNTGQSGSMPDADVDAPEAWDITPGGSSSVVIGVLDTGVDLTHPDLAANIFVNAGEIPGNAIDDDANGWIDDVNGWDFAMNDNDPSPTGVANPHGTGVIGMAAAVGDNAVGVAGVAYRSKILPVRIFGDTNNAPTNDGIASAIYYAAGRTADGLGTWPAGTLMNNSWGGGPNDSDPVITDAFAWATASARGGKGVPVFIASGNGGFNGVAYPANLSLSNPGVVAVGASTDLDTWGSYSQYGAALDVLAPSSGGMAIIVTTDIQGAGGANPLGDYSDTPESSGGGTSIATPMATGVAALVLALDFNLTAATLKQLLRGTTDYIDAGVADYSPTTGFSATHGYGKVNAFTAVRGVGVARIQLLLGTQSVAASSAMNFTANLGAVHDVTYRIRNQGTQPLNLGALTLAAGPFSVPGGIGSSSLAVGQSTTFTVRYAPTASGDADRTLTFTTNDAANPVIAIALHGVPTFASSVNGLTVNGGAAQRSRLTTIAVQFAGPVNIAQLGPVTLTRTAALIGGSVGTVVDASNGLIVTPATGTASSVTLTFTLAVNPGVQYGSLADGVWQLAIPYLNYTSPPGDPNLRRLFGDFNNDGTVNGAVDFPAFGADFNAGVGSPFDYNADGSVDGAVDFPAFGARFNAML